MSLPGDGAASADDEASTGLPPQPGRAGRVLLFFLYLFGFAFSVPMIVVRVVQARYGLIDGPPSFPVDPFGERVKSITKYGIFVWAGLQFFIFGRVASWASRMPAVPGIEPVAAEMLMQRLLGINEQDVPYTIKRGGRPDEIVVDRRYALDATKISPTRFEWTATNHVAGSETGVLFFWDTDAEASGGQE
jgi:hypothetical protein